jgi:membrane protease YdiL (CAAX protease family)
MADYIFPCVPCVQWLKTFIDLFLLLLLYAIANFEEYFMNKIWKNPLARVIIVVLLAFLVFQAAGFLKTAIKPLLPVSIANDSGSMGAIFKTLLALTALIVIWLIPGKHRRDFGLCLPKRLNYLKLVGITFITTVGGMFIFVPLYMGFLSNIFRVKMSGGFDFGSSIWVMIIGIWFWSSVTEEIFARSLVQSLLQDLSKHRLWGLSLPVWISALVFGAGHLTVFKLSGSPFFVMFIVSNAFIMGLVAARYREKSGSIIPAILVHILSNIFGSLPSIFFN